MGIYLVLVFSFCVVGGMLALAQVVWILADHNCIYNSDHNLMSSIGVMLMGSVYISLSAFYLQTIDSAAVKFWKSATTAAQAEKLSQIRRHKTSCRIGKT
eukprot:UN01028